MSKKSTKKALEVTSPGHLAELVRHTGEPCEYLPALYQKNFPGQDSFDVVVHVGDAGPGERLYRLSSRHRLDYSAFAAALMARWRHWGGRAEYTHCKEVLADFLAAATGPAPAAPAAPRQRQQFVQGSLFD